MPERPFELSFSIRGAAEQDARTIAALMSQLGYPTSEPDMNERLAAIRADSNYRTLVAEAGGTVVGMVGVGLMPYYECNGVYGRLLALAVDEACRGYGMGRALVKAAENWALARGATAMIVNSGHQREEAHRYYERIGYRV